MGHVEVKIITQITFILILVLVKILQHTTMQKNMYLYLDTENVYKI